MKKIVALIGALAFIVFGMGSLALSSPANAKPQQHVPVDVCHATSSDTNPYVFLTVDDDSAKLQGHLMHRNDPNKTWKSDGTWNGIAHSAGDPKRDYIDSFTDTDGVFHQLDGDVTETFCNADVVPPNCDNSPSPETCPQPPAEHREKTDVAKDCDAGTITTTVHDYTTEYVWDSEQQKWVLGSETEDQGSPHVTSVPTTEQDCPVDQPTEVTPVLPTVTEPTCDTDGSLVKPEQPEGVVATYDPADSTGPGTYHVTFSPKDDTYVLSDGSETEATVTVLAATGDCPQPPCTENCTPQPPHHNPPPNNPPHHSNPPKHNAPPKATPHVPTVIGAGLSGNTSASSNGEVIAWFALGFFGTALLLLAGAGTVVMVRRRGTEK